MLSVAGQEPSEVCLTGYLVEDEYVGCSEYNPLDIDFDESSEEDLVQDGEGVSRDDQEECLLVNEEIDLDQNNAEGVDDE